MWKIVIDKTVSHNRNSKKRSLWKWIINSEKSKGVKFASFIGRRKTRKNIRIEFQFENWVAFANYAREMKSLTGLSSFIWNPIVCHIGGVNKIGFLRSIYTGHYRWSSNQMDFMSRGHHSSGDFCWMIFIFWFRAPPFSFFLFQSSIILFSLAKRSSDFWPHESLMSSMIHHPSDCFLAFWIGKVRFLYFFSTKIIP